MDSPGGSVGALQELSHNQQRAETPLFAAIRRGDDARDSSVVDKIAQFNTLAQQSKQLERKTADAALKRAMLGREEAEAEMRRYRDEARLLKRHLEEGRDRERKVGERLEQVMENYGRAKETHAHTQALWEKEIRRARKETFKSQSALVKLQEELQSARTAQKATAEELDREKERSKEREQEAFAARYTLVGLQEQLDQALERVRILEQERDAFKTIAKNEEEVARIASQGKLPLPPSPAEDDEFASPYKRPVRVSSINVKASASTEAEIEELIRLWHWEKQRADRAVEHVEFLEVECHLKVCPAAKSKSLSRSSTVRPPSPRRRRATPSKIVDAGDLVILSESSAPSSPGRKPSPKRSKTDRLREDKELRRSTIFVPSEGIFRTVTQYEAENAAAAAAQSAPEIVLPSIESSTEDEPISSQAPTPTENMPSVYARTPSVDPPDFATLAHQRMSLLSLLDADHRDVDPPTKFNIPTTPGPAPPSHQNPVLGRPKSLSPASSARSSCNNGNDNDDLDVDTEAENTITTTTSGQYTPTQLLRGPSLEALPINGHLQQQQQHQNQTAPAALPPPLARTPEQQQDETEKSREQEEKQSAILSMSRPHTTAAHYAFHATTTTTKVPLREETKDPNMAARLMKLQRTPSHGDNQPSFDVNNPALTPTMTREQALAQIRERRGRARSVNGKGGGVTSAPTTSSAVTPRRQMLEGVERRDVSAPAGTTVRSGRITPGPVGMRRVRS
ncbi:hypothetical protein B0H66DRAFT_345824 [Apodospora peruviana]|uniref:Uncharacterized protein n=1 Tax=Apodospora peruviana TaxID=516989 RepID=A0AAE0HYZ4_9PEZI|nr:hypothetical protein B0H66DRAFT_345824 [Apodospora peruviana]